MSTVDGPNVPLAAALILIFTSVALVGMHQANKLHSPAEVSSALIVKSVTLRFVDHQDGMNAFGGHVDVYDAATGAAYRQLRENDGFIRAVLNSLSFERSKSGIAAAPLFRLAYWTDNKVTLEDLATGKRISLGAFGAKNKEVFLRFFNEPEAKT